MAADPRTRNAAGKVAQAAKQNPVLAAGAAAAVVATTGGVAVGALVGQRRTQRCIDAYLGSLQAYLEAMQSGTLTVEVAEDLVKAISALEARGRRSGSVQPDRALVQFLTDCTRQLAAYRHVAPPMIETSPTALGAVRAQVEAQRQLLAIAT